MHAQKLIESLIDKVTSIRRQVEKIQQQDPQVWTWREATGSWNMLECLEHLNLYGDHYLLAIDKGITGTSSKSKATFKPGWLGSYFAKSMLPGKKMKKMKTFRDKDPWGSELNAGVIVRFLEQQDRLLELLERSRNADLSGIRIPTSISPVIRLKLGDTFQFFVNHMMRHMVQIQRIEKGFKAGKTLETA